MDNRITVKPGSHRGQKVLFIHFEKNQELIQEVKKIEGSRWSQEKQVWYVKDTDNNRTLLQLPLQSHYLPSDEGIEHIEKFKQWLRSKRYSESTVATYSDALKSFLVFYREKTIGEINNEDVVVYNNEYILKNKLSASYQNQIVNSIKLFFQTIRNTKMLVDKIHRPRPEHKLPNVLSKEEVKCILNALTNIKHKTMLSLMAEREQLGVIADQIGTPTWTNTLAQTLWHCCAQRPAGIWHCADNGVASWYDFAVAIQEEALSLGLLSKAIPIKPLRTAQYPTPAQRPAYSVMDKQATESLLGKNLPHWRVSLRSMLKQLNAQGAAS